MALEFIRKSGIVFFLISSFALAQWANHPVISEILYDERSGMNEEFVELYNPTADTVCLKGWTLEYMSREGGSWRVKVIFQSGQCLKPLGFFLWGGDGVSPEPDIVETSQRSIGLSNSGGHIALRDSGGTIVDLVAWEGGLFPEGSGDAGTTEDGGSLVRKASIQSTAASLGMNGIEEKEGHGFDTNDNASDFVIQPADQVRAQNTRSAQEPDPRFFFGAGSAVLTPALAYCGRIETFHLRISSETERLVQQAAVLFPWSMDIMERVSFYESGISEGSISVSGDTLLISGLNLFGEEFIEMVIESASIPEQSGIYPWIVLTVTEENPNLRPLSRSPNLRVVEPPVPIISLHQNDTSGVSLYLGETATISGIITAESGLFSPSFTDVFLQDTTGGMRIYNSNSPLFFNYGDSATLTGTITQFHGMTQLVPFWDQVIIHSQNHEPPEPVNLTCAAVNETFKPEGIESLEGCLIRIENALYDPAASVLTDISGSCSLYLDPDLEIDPVMGRYDVTGLLTQYKPGNGDPGPPYISDYSVQIRYSSDMIPRPCLQLVQMPNVTAWHEDGIELCFQTNLPCRSQILFGNSISYTQQIDEPVMTEHQVRLTNLKPATIYHYQVICQEAETLKTRDAMFITRSPAGSAGQIQIFFNGSVDGSNARISPANGNDDLIDRLVTRIQASSYSIDACFMKLTERNVRDALIEAFEQGVAVRFICEQDEFSRPEVQALKTAGIPVLTDLCGNNDGSGTMHHKFAVFDNRNSSSFEDDWVWTGSFNLTDYGSIPKPYENTVCIQDQALAVLYTEEFEEMWGSNTDVPDPQNARFGYRKTDNIPHQIMVGEILIEVYMSPSEKASEAIERAIASTDASLCFSMFSFTRTSIADAVSAFTQNSEISVFGLFDGSQIQNDGTYSQWPVLSSAFPEQMRKYPGPEILHHKYAVVDGETGDADPLVITGSYNWTNSAENRNDENVLIIHSAEAADQYLQEFRKRYEKGTNGLYSSTLPEAWRLFQNYPNPFNHATSLYFEIPVSAHVIVEITDIQGKQVIRLMDGKCEPGTYTVLWNGSDSHGRPVSSGIYMIALRSRDFHKSIKMVFLR